MEVFSFLLEFIGSASGLLAYALVFGILFACGLGLPLPEDVALITGGYLVYKGQADLGLMLLAGFTGILAGDSMIFYLGRAGRKMQGKRPGGLLARHLTPERIAKVEAQFEKRGSMMIVIARFLPGLRAATYFVAGGAQMSYRRFIFFDGLAALLSAPVFVLLGSHFGKQIHDVIGWAEEFHLYLIGAVALAAVGFGVRWLIGKGAQRRKEREAAALAGRATQGRADPTLPLVQAKPAPMAAAAPKAPTADRRRMVH